MVQFPKIIQGGMGVGVSNWRLAQAVSRLGQLGVVSGTALDQVFVRRLADGDFGGHMRRALDSFPFPEMARRLWQEYFVAGGKPAGTPYRITPMHQRRDPRKLIELCMVAKGTATQWGSTFSRRSRSPTWRRFTGPCLRGWAMC